MTDLPAPIAPPLDRLTTLVGADVTNWRAVSEGGYSAAGRWLIEFGEGRSAFVKLGADRHSSVGIRVELEMYMGADLACVPRLVGYDDDADGDGAAPLLVIEDLGAARWAPPWPQIDVDELLASLEPVFDAAPPDIVTRAAAWNPGCAHWRSIEADPAGSMLAAQVCTSAWLSRALPTLRAAAEQFDPTAGSRLTHGDLFPQNWCITARGPVFVDWSSARLGNPDADRVHLLLGVRVASNADELVFSRTRARAAVPAQSVAWFAGRLAEWAAQQRDTKPARFVETQRRELWHGLCWAADVLDVEPPTLPPGAPPIGDYRP